MLPIVPYKLDEIKTDLTRYAIENLGLLDAEFEGSNISQLINLLSYSNTINNTNLMFGLNEMFITQAKDRKNVLKHAKQLGYNYRRNVSFKYRIKLKSNKEGKVVLPKYQKFTSGDNNYIYMGEDIVDFYGTRLTIKNISKPEFSNTDLKKGDFIKSGDIIAEVTKVINNSSDREMQRVILSTIGENRLKEYSETPNELLIQVDTEDNKRVFKSIGKINTFLLDGNIMKIQLNDVEDFPIYSSEIIYDKIVNDSITLKNKIKYIKELSFGEEHIDINTVKINDNIINFPKTTKLDMLFSVDNSGQNKAKLVDDKFVLDIDEDLTEYKVDIYTNNTLEDPNNYTIFKTFIEFLGTKRFEFNEFVIENNKVKDLIVSKEDLRGVYLKNKFIDERIEVDYVLNNGIITFDKDYSEYIAEVEYYGIKDIRKEDIRISYSKTMDLNGKNVKVEYVYDKGDDGLLDKSFFFSDLVGEYPENELIKTENNPNGWGGFKAFDYDDKNNVISFNVDNNFYVRKLSEDNLIYLDAERLDEVLRPFKSTRIELLEDFNPETLEYTLTDIKWSIRDLSFKDTLEIIVKEGLHKKHTDEDDKGNPKHPELNFIINKDIERLGYFTLFAPNIENNGIEMFRETDGNYDEYLQRKDLLTEKYNWDNAPELKDYKNYTDYEVALSKWQQLKNNSTFLVTSNLDYEDYINIYTSYAGTGIPMKVGDRIGINMLFSKGINGNTNELIQPIESDFVCIPFENTMQNILHTQGTNLESTDSIRNNAPLYSNTANRAVTANDYMTICDSQPYINSSKVWGGEDIPNIDLISIKEYQKEHNDYGTSEEQLRYIRERFGQIYISVIPQSKSLIFLKKDYSYILKDSNNFDLFYPSYEQITGENTNDDDNILFKTLDNYKVITLNLNYTKVIYLDIEITIFILNYKNGKKIEDTNSDVFESLKNYIHKDVEKFDGELYKSSVIKYIDKELGDNFGLDMKMKFFIDLWDNYEYPNKGSFTNLTKKSLDINPNGTIQSNFSGSKDTWKVDLYLNHPNDLFENDFITENGEIYKGNLILENLPYIDTKDFITKGDRIYTDINTEEAKGITEDGNLEYGKDISKRTEFIEFPLIYAVHGREYTIGSYIISNKEKIIIVRILSSNNSFKNTDEKYINRIKTTLDRDDFVSSIRKLELFSSVTIDNKIVKNSSFIATKNICPRLRRVNFL